MSDKKINIVYIDDNSDEILSQYMTRSIAPHRFNNLISHKLKKSIKRSVFVGMKVMKHYSKMLLLKLQM